MYRFLQALLLALIAGYIAWMTVDLQNVHEELSRIQHSLARTSLVPADTPSDNRSGRRNLPERVYVTTTALAYVFKPQKLVVKVGARVTWVNQTAASHSVTSVGPRFFDRLLRPHGHVTIRFRSIGAYPYYCRFHPYQRGEIVVVP
jgi:plastocyanin